MGFETAKRLPTAELGADLNSIKQWLPALGQLHPLLLNSRVHVLGLLIHGLVILLERLDGPVNIR